MSIYVTIRLPRGGAGHWRARLSHDRQLDAGSWLWIVPDAPDARPWHPRGCLLVSPFSTGPASHRHRLKQPPSSDMIARLGAARRAGRWCRSSNVYRLLAGTAAPSLSMPLTCLLDLSPGLPACPVEPARDLLIARRAVMAARFAEMAA